MIKLILSDLDGTLVPEGCGQLPQRLIDTVKKLEGQGVRFGISSGRQWASIRKVLQPLGETPIIAALNGGYVCQGDTCLFSDPMPAQTAQEIAEEAAKLPWADVIIETGEQCFVLADRNGVMEQLNMRKYVCRAIADWSEVEGEVIKVACYLPQRVEEFLDLAQARWGGDVSVVRAGACWVDFTRADKGKGLQALCDALGIEREETLSFGDNLNDAPLLAAAGTAYAVAHGNPALKAMFPVCEDPISVMEKFLEI